MFDLKEDIFYWFSEPDKLHYDTCIFIIFFGHAAFVSNVLTYGCISQV